MIIITSDNLYAICAFELSLVYFYILISFFVWAFIVIGRLYGDKFFLYLYSFHSDFIWKMSTLTTRNSGATKPKNEILQKMESPEEL